MALLTISNLFPTSFFNDSNILDSLGEEFSLCGNGNMAFHWADFHETCDAIKGQIETNAQLMDDFKRREMGLARLALIPVWIRTHAKVHQTTMYDLYERYVLNQSYLMGVDPFGPIEISFISGTGPFKSLAVAECFNKATYIDFVLIYLLQNKLPRRDYRIRLKAKVLLEYGVDFQKAQLIQLEQLTTSGLLFSLDSEFFLKEVSKESQIRFLVNTQVLKDVSSKTLPEIQTHLSQFAFNLLYSARKEDGINCALADFNIQSSFDFLKSKKVYLFIAYNKLQAESQGSIKNIQDFIHHSRELVRDHYRHLPTMKSA
jgi:hypothetical protein